MKEQTCREREQSAPGEDIRVQLLNISDRFSQRSN